jgi:hypothetical protein
MSVTNTPLTSTGNVSSTGPSDEASSKAKSGKPALTKLDGKEGQPFEKDSDIGKALQHAKNSNKLPSCFKRCLSDRKLPHSGDLKNYAVIKIGDLCVLAKHNPNTKTFDVELSVSDIAKMGLVDRLGNDLGEAIQDALNTKDDSNFIKRLFHRGADKRSFKLSIGADGNINCSAQMRNNRAAENTVGMRLTYDPVSNKLKADISVADFVEQTDAMIKREKPPEKELSVVDTFDNIAAGNPNSVGGPNNEGIGGGGDGDVSTHSHND